MLLNRGRKCRKATLPAMVRESNARDGDRPLQKADEGSRQKIAEGTGSQNLVARKS